MRMTKKRKAKMQIRRYRSVTDDFIESKNQTFCLPEDYAWLREGLFDKGISGIVYLLGTAFAYFYCRFYLHMKIKNKRIIRKYRNTGFFLYGNHTQPIGDAFIPIRTVFPKRGYAVVSPANLGIPFLGPLLPALGALPVPASFEGMKKLDEAIRQRIREKRFVVFYPEAHVWPWYTGIRPFPAVSFGYPVNCKAPSFCMTATYQKRKYRKKPFLTVYLDGPFYPDTSLPRKEQKNRLCDEIYRCMLRRSKESNYQYIRYEEEES